MQKIIYTRIMKWYTKHQRSHLPWRFTRDPYKILIAEVMLQQTQVERVILKYKEFLRLFPTVKKLATAKTADVIRAWRGLGYNRRALFLQKTSQAIVKKHKGTFPSDIESLKQLPGVGDYTARAILSFAFGEPVPMMDTNHRRFYQRVFFGLRIKDDKTLLKKAEDVVGMITPSQPPPTRGRSHNRRQESVYDWNQALMDFGSLVCLTGRPLCEVCPIRKYCVAYPRILDQKSKSRLQKRKKKHVPFKETDRYYRGQIINLLRDKPSMKEEFLYKLFSALDQKRLDKIIAHLEKDGLIQRKKKGILLP